MAARCARRNHKRLTHGQPRMFPATTSSKPPTTNTTTLKCRTRTASASSRYGSVDVFTAPNDKAQPPREQRRDEADVGYSDCLAGKLSSSAETHWYIYESRSFMQSSYLELVSSMHICNQSASSGLSCRSIHFSRADSCSSSQSVLHPALMFEDTMSGTANDNDLQLPMSSLMPIGPPQGSYLPPLDGARNLFVSPACRPPSVA